MSTDTPSLISPIEEYECRLERQAYRAWVEVRLCAVLWSISQCYALVDYGLGQILRPNYDADAAVTTGLIWLASFPCAIGAGVLSLAGWNRLKFSRVVVGLVPWLVTLAEATAVLWWLFA